MKTLLRITLILFLSTLLISAQEKELDKTPFPVGGIKEIAKNVKYPESARKDGVQGKVLVKAFVDKNGNVTKTIILTSLNADCDKAAEIAIKKTKFEPAQKDGKNVDAEVTIPISFKLDEKKKEKQK